MLGAKFKILSLNHVLEENLNKMLLEVEYRAVIKYLTKKQLSGKQILEELQNTYGSESPSKTTVYYWVSEFKNGRTSVTDESRCGRPTEISDSKSDQLLSIIRNERRITIRDLAERLNVSYGTVQSKLKELGIRKLASRFVPRFLSGEMMDNRLASCEGFCALYEQYGDNFLKNILTEDETVLTMYLPESKRESAEWKLSNEKPSLKMRSGTSHRRIFMLSLFWDYNGVVVMDFADKDIKINSEYYVNLLKAAREKRRKPRGLPYWLLHDNAPIHSSRETQSAIENLGIEPLDHPAYSPDLAPSDFYVFRLLKKHLRGKKNDDKNELKATVEEFFKTQQPSFFQSAFHELLIRWNKCVESKGSYVEK